MKLLPTWLPLACCLTFGSAYAHTHLVSSVPAEGATLASSPPALVLRFSEEARIATATIQRAQEPGQLLRDQPATAAQSSTLPLPPLAVGAYTVRWRVLGRDSHVMSGELHFSIVPPNAKRPAPAK